MKFSFRNNERGWLGLFKRPFGKLGDKKLISGKSSYPLNLEKHLENPIIMPRSTNGWEAWQVFNPGAILLDDKVHFLYRAIGEDGMSRLGYAGSPDGFKIYDRLDFPVYEHATFGNSYSVYSLSSGGSWSGCEDPRIVRVEDEDRIYVTYTACDDGLRVALTSIKVDDFLKKKWKWKKPMLISKPGEVNKNWVIFPEKINGKYAVLHSVNPKIEIAYVEDLEFEEDEWIDSQHNDLLARQYVHNKRDGTKCWHSYVRGVGPPPIRTKHGWLLFYHALDSRDPGKYKLGAMLLDINDPTKILIRSKEPILEPSEEYEYNGFKGGIVYAIGAVVKGEDLLVYYGSADNYICVAKANFNDFVEELKKSARPKLLRMLFKKRH